jgi:long-chain acyl-CoA synthetase
MTETARSIAEMFVRRVAETPDRRAFQHPVGDRWPWLTWGETAAQVRAIALGLHSLGLTSEQRVSILSTTRLEWILAELGILCAAGATTTIYPSNTAEECHYILVDSETVIVFAENDEQVAKIAANRAVLPEVRKVVTFDGRAGHDGWVITLADLEALGRALDAAHPRRFDELVRSVRSEHLATLIYTSGTTGVPKGVELTHDCWVFEAGAIDALGILRPDDHQYLWLPLSHSFGKVLVVAQIAIGFQTTVDGRIANLVENLGAVKPEFMAAAPRIFEKVYNRIITGVRSSGLLRRRIFDWAMGIGRRVSQVRQGRRKPSGLLALENALADRLVFRKIRDRFGGRIRFFVSGSAPLSREMAEFFHAIGILILEGYGLTESSAANFVNLPGSFVFGTVGPPLPGVEVKIAQDDGEILLNGRCVMRGYHNQPEATAEALKDGWLHTGDIGELTPQGFLRITDRKKDLIKTSGGKYVAPQAIEASLKALCPYLSHVLVHGNNRNFCTALVTLDPDSIKSWLRRQGMDGTPSAELANDERVVRMVRAAVEELNGKLASYETIKKFAILPGDFTVEGGELTASMKVRRKVVEEKYKDLLDGFYREAVTGT